MKKRLNTPIVWGIFLLLGILIGSYFSTEGSVEETTHKESELWTCSMDPQVQKDGPGACPICGMDLIKAQKNGASELAPDEVRLSPRALALAQIQTTPVRALKEGSTKRTLVGRVRRNSDKTKIVSAWFSGRIDKLVVSSIGEKVRSNQSVAYLYSPEIYAAHRDLMTAQTQKNRLADADAFSKMATDGALEAAKTRLGLLGVKESEIRRMAAAKNPWTRVPLRSPFSGTVVKKFVNAGEYVKEGQPLFEISDLGALWIELDVYAVDLPGIEVGQKLNFSIDGLPNIEFDGKVSFIEPFVNEQTRTATVRIECENDGRIKPGQFVNASLDLGPAASNLLVIPKSAPLFAGRRAIVYVEKQSVPEPIYLARSVRLGQQIGDDLSVVEGLEIGERVVSEGAFTLDADLQIRGGLSLLARPDDRQRLEFDLGEDFSIHLKAFFLAYLKIQEALAADDFNRAQAGSVELKTKVSKIRAPDLKDAQRKKWDGLHIEISDASRNMTESKTIGDIRKHFEPLSNATLRLLRATGNPLDIPLSYSFCPMAFENRGASWLQSGAEVRNAYYGSSMLSCGTIKETIAPQNQNGKQGQ